MRQPARALILLPTANQPTISAGMVTARVAIVHERIGRSSAATRQLPLLLYVLTRRLVWTTSYLRVRHQVAG